MVPNLWFGTTGASKPTSKCRTLLTVPEVRYDWIPNGLLRCSRTGPGWCYTPLHLVRSSRPGEGPEETALADLDYLEVPNSLQLVVKTAQFRNSPVHRTQQKPVRNDWFHARRIPLYLRTAAIRRWSSTPWHPPTHWPIEAIAGARRPNGALGFTWTHPVGGNIWNHMEKYQATRSGSLAIQTWKRIRTPRCKSMFQHLSIPRTSFLGKHFCLLWVKGDFARAWAFFSPV